MCKQDEDSQSLVELKYYLWARAAFCPCICSLSELWALFASWAQLAHHLPFVPSANCLQVQQSIQAYLFSSHRFVVEGLRSSSRFWCHLFSDFNLRHKKMNRMMCAHCQECKKMNRCCKEQRETNEKKKWQIQKLEAAGGQSSPGLNQMVSRISGPVLRNTFIIFSFIG